MPLRRVQVAIVGLGRLGLRCLQLAREAADLELCGFVRSGKGLPHPLSPVPKNVPTVSHISELTHVEAALVCVPSEAAPSVVTELIQHKVPVVECASMDEPALAAYYGAVNRLAHSHGVPAMVGAGWNPGLQQQLEQLFQLLIPKGVTRETNSPGLNLHHTEVARGIDGVKAALATEVRADDGRLQHYLYIELAAHGNVEKVQRAVASDPAFAGEEVFAFQVESVAALEQRGHGVLLERLGSTGSGAHETLLIEGRFDPYTLSARLMLEAARRVDARWRGAHRFCPLRTASIG